MNMGRLNYDNIIIVKRHANDITINWESKVDGHNFRFEL